MKDADAWFKEGLHHIGMSYSADSHSELLGDLESALAAFDQALALQPDHADSLAEKAIALARLDRHEEAAAAFAQAIGQSPENAQLRLLRARSLNRLGRHEEALVASDEVLARRAEDVEALYLRALALDALGRNEAALEAWDCFLQQPDPRSLHVHPGRARLARATALARAGRHAEALAGFLESIRDGECFRAERDFHAALGTVDAAREAYAAYLASKATDPLAWIRAGQTYLRAGLVAQSLKAYETATRVAPGNADAWWGVAEAMARAGRREESIAMFDQALRLAPDYLGVKARRQVVLREMALARDADDSKRPGARR